MRKIKIAQVGIGHDHAPVTFKSIMRQSDIFECIGVVVCDGEEERWDGGMWKDYTAVPRMTLDELLGVPELDAVAIECDDWDLTKYSMIFAERGVHIHMDKPGGTDQADYERMLSVMKRKGLVFQTGYMYRYNPVIAETLEAAKRGEFGEIYAVEAHMDCIHTEAKRAWLGAFRGGMMYFLGCHLIDLILLFCGLPEEILPLNMSTGFDGVDAEDYGMAVLKYKNGLSFAKTSAAEPGGFMRRQLVVCGRDKTREIKPIELYVENGNMVSPAVTRERGSGWTDSYPEVVTEPFDRYDTMMRHFAEYIFGERENPYTYEYEATLHRAVLAACGEDVDYKAKIEL